MSAQARLGLVTTSPEPWSRALLGIRVTPAPRHERGMGSRPRSVARQTMDSSPRRRPLLYELGVRMARRPRVVLLLWALLLAGAGAMYPVLEARVGTPDYTIRGSESVRAQALLAERFPELGMEQNLVVFRSATYQVDNPRYRSIVDQVLNAIRGSPHVTTVISPYDSPGDQVAADRKVSIALIGLRGQETARTDAATDLQRRVHRVAGGSQVEAYLTGPSPLTVDLSAMELHDQNIAEIIGIPIALMVLVVSLGALIAAMLPIVIALGSVLVCMAILALMATPLHLDRFVTVITTVIGIGIGIDYSLFVVSRFREELAKRTPADRRATRGAVGDAIGMALQTSGRTIVTSGIIVIVALASMALINGHIFMEIAVASALVVACCLATALTLLPALLATLGRRVNAGALPRRLRPVDVSSSGGAAQGRWAGWARFVLRRPVLLGLPALVLLAVLAWPVSSIRLGLDWGLGALNDTPSGRGHQIVAASFSPGAVGPVDIIACARHAPLDTAQLDGLARLTAALHQDSRAARVTSLTDVLDQQFGGHSAGNLQEANQRPAVRSVVSRLVDVDKGSQCARVQVILAHPIDAPDSSGLVVDLRRTMAPDAFAGTGVEVKVGGLTAQHVDISAETVGKLPWVIAIVLALSFCYLLGVFRSIFVPAKAVVLTLLATAASLGLTVFVFQYGHGAGLLGFTSVGTLQAYLPVALFALLFGLSMDYEVFLVSRIQEEWLRGGHDNARAVATAVDHTARQITAGAAIMVAVFGSLLVAQVLELKQFGFGLAVAVFIDATVVRLLLVPAAMGLASGANWWLPRWLAAILPSWRPE